MTILSDDLDKRSIGNDRETIALGSKTEITKLPAIDKRGWPESLSLKGNPITANQISNGSVLAYN